MKELKLIQCSTGRYNWASNEPNLNFSMGIYEDENLVEKDGIKAIIYYSGNVEELNEFQNYADDNYVAGLFENCFNYAQLVISTTNYQGQCLLFAKEYRDNFEELSKNKAIKEKQKIEKQIAELQNRLTHNLGLENYSEEVLSVVDKEIAKYKRWIDSTKKEISQYKESSEKITELQKRIDRYEQNIKELNII